MTTKTCIWIGFFIGSTAGQFVPLLWGGSSLSFASIITAALGGLLGIWAGFRAGNAYFG